MDGLLKQLRSIVALVALGPIAGVAIYAFERDTLRALSAMGAMLVTLGVIGLSTTVRMGSMKNITLFVVAYSAFSLALFGTSYLVWRHFL